MGEEESPRGKNVCLFCFGGKFLLEALGTMLEFRFPPKGFSIRKASGLDNFKRFKGPFESQVKVKSVVFEVLG
jgi:hypothetical protein